MSATRSLGQLSALVSCMATFASYIGGVMVGCDIYQRYQERKSNAELPLLQTDPYAPGRPSLPQEAGVFGLSLATGFAGIALAKSGRRRAKYGRSQSISYGSSYGHNSSYDYDEGFWDGYWFASISSGSSGSSSSSSSSGDDNSADGAIVVLVIGAIAALATFSTYVSWKAFRGNFLQNEPSRFTL